jgi:HPt (histidine-containing phosphotransfer) domain-containing protein
MCFNRDAALERVAGDDELLAELTQLFLKESPPLLERVRSAVSSADAEQLMEAAHSIRGSLATVGGEEAAQAAVQLELMGRRGELQGSTEALSNLERAVAALEQELHAYHGDK